MCLRLSRAGVVRRTRWSRAARAATILRRSRSPPERFRSRDGLTCPETIAARDRRGRPRSPGGPIRWRTSSLFGADVFGRAILTDALAATDAVYAGCRTWQRNPTMLTALSKARLLMTKRARLLMTRRTRVRRGRRPRSRYSQLPPSARRANAAAAGLTTCRHARVTG